MSLQKTLIGAIVLFAVTLFIVKVEIPRQEREEKAELFLEGATSADIDSINVVADASDPFTLSSSVAEESKEAGQSWTLTIGAGEKAIQDSMVDEGAVNTLISQLERLKLSNAIPKEDVEGDLGVYGLDKPSLVLTVEANSKKHSLEFGKLNSFTGDRYVREVDSARTFLVSNTVYTSVNKKPLEMRSKNRLEFDRTDLREIELIHGGASAVKLQSGNGLNWRITAPIEAPADQVAVTELLRQIRGLRASDIFDTEEKIPEEFKGRQPDVVAHLVESEGETKTSLRVALTANTSDNPQMLVSEEGSSKPPFSVAGNTISKFRVGVEQLRQKRFFDFDTGALESAQFSVDGAEVLRLEKKEDEWHVNGEKGDLVFVEEYLEALANFEAEDFPDSSSTGELSVDSPFFKVDLSFGDKGQRTLLVGPKTGNGPEQRQHLVEVGPTKDVFFVSPSRLETILPKPETLLTQKSPEDKAGMENETVTGNQDKE